ncbi:exodeoxyribonuclease 7 large subunit [Alphaproteobacteria bacterium]|nr:exodeoxyribonuclease 7 large subunit [Alphaproteobacteria bacterium]
MKINIPELSVSEFSKAIKNLVEDAFGYIRIRGEITGFKKATSGHLYFNLKDNDATLTAVCFRGSAMGINFEMADGLQVCVSGKITTYEGRSNYQIIVEKVEIAGIGAILEMLEKRKQKLASEGLFDATYKKPLPFFPKIIGVITSPTGAVIEDIKHRISQRCPTKILLFEATVQGERAAKDVCEGIKYFNNMRINRPDLIIIARGGGSFEDLLPFSDEELVRTAFKSNIPIISAIGHETDNCLLDLVADVRAPTPTGAAEIATVLLSDLKNKVKDYSQNIEDLVLKYVNENSRKLSDLKRFLTDPKVIIENYLQKVEQYFSKTELLVKNYFSLQSAKIKAVNLITAQNILQNYNLKLSQNQQKIKIIVDNIIAKNQQYLDSLKISSQVIEQKINFNQQHLNNNFIQLSNKIKSYFYFQENHFAGIVKALQANHYKNILQRGFAFVRNDQNQVVNSVNKLHLEQNITLELFDGEIKAQVKKI